MWRCDQCGDQLPLDMQPGHIQWHKKQNQLVEEMAAADEEEKKAEAKYVNDDEDGWDL